MEFTLSNSAEAPRIVAEKLAAFAAGAGIAPGVLFAADHSLAEHLQNVVDHSGAQEIGVRFAVEEGELRLTVTDDGAQFDPLSAPEPQLDLTLERRPIGGLGVHMMRRLMTRLQHERREGRNVLTMSKQLG